MNVLWLSPWFPYPLANGSKIRIYHLIRTLARQHPISLISFVRSGEQVQPDGLDGICVSLDTVPWRPFQPKSLKSLFGFFSPTPRSVINTHSATMDRAIAQHICNGNPDLIIASQLATAPYLAHYPNFLKIFEEVELGTLWDARSNARTRQERWRRTMTLNKTRRYLGNLLSQYQAATVVSKEEKALLEDLNIGSQKLILLPNGVDTETLQPGLASPQPGRLIYPGSLTYSANYDAVSFFLAEIFPRIYSEMPDIEFHITGTTQNVDITGLQLTPHVTLTGYVSDIYREIAKAWICVVPLRQGGGSRLKILEAMALGTPVVSTSKGAQGLEVNPGKDILIADDPIQFATQTLRLLNDASLRESIATHARKLVEQNYNWDKIGEKFCELANHLLTPGSR